MKFCKKSDVLGIFETHNRIQLKLLHFFSGIYFFVTRFSLLCTLFAAVTVLLAMSVYQVIVNSILPSSNTVPVIGEYTQLLKTNNQMPPHENRDIHVAHGYFCSKISKLIQYVYLCNAVLFLPRLVYFAFCRVMQQRSQQLSI